MLNSQIDVDLIIYFQFIENQSYMFSNFLFRRVGTSSV